MRKKKRNGSGTLDSFFSRIDKQIDSNIKATYNKATGWLGVSFPSKPSTDILTGLKMHGFRWKPRAKRWSGKWTATREEHLKGLAGKIEKIDIQPNYRRKAEWASEQASKHLVESNARYDQFRRELKTIPMGQPILVGHHSEKSHRAHLRRLDMHIKKSMEEKGIAQRYKERSQRYKRKARGEPAGLIYRRIRKLEAEERGWKRSLQRLKDNREIAKKRPKFAKEYHIKANPEEEARCKKHLDFTRERLKIERKSYKATGGIAMEKMTFKKGDMVRTSYGVAEVVKVNPQTVKVILQGRSWPLKIDKSEIRGKA